jgi:hypothetical protein
MADGHRRIQCATQSVRYAVEFIDARHRHVTYGEQGACDKEKRNQRPPTPARRECNARARTRQRGRPHHRHVEGV